MKHCNLNNSGVDYMRNWKLKKLNIEMLTIYKTYPNLICNSSEKNNDVKIR